MPAPHSVNSTDFENAIVSLAAVSYREFKIVIIRRTKIMIRGISVFISDCSMERVVSQKHYVKVVFLQLNFFTKFELSDGEKGREVATCVSFRRLKLI